MFIYPIHAFFLDNDKKVADPSGVDHMEHQPWMADSFDQHFDQKTAFTVRRQEESTDSTQYQGRTVSAGMLFPLVFPFHFQKQLDVALFIKNGLTQVLCFLLVLLLNLLQFQLMPLFGFLQFQLIFLFGFLHHLIFLSGLCQQYLFVLKGLPQGLDDRLKLICLIFQLDIL